ncbi:MAG: hypothetical protein R6V60_09365 [Desulfobacterales bacterium]
MKNISLSIAVVLLLCSTLPAMGGAFRPEADPLIWNRSSADLPAFAPPDQASKRDNEDNRGFTSETRPAGQFFVDMSPYLPNVCVMATPIKYEGTHIDNMRLDFGDEGMHANNAFDSKTAFNDVFVALYYGLPYLKTVSQDKLNIDLGINVRTIDFHEDIQLKSIAQAPGSIILPVPMVFAAVQFQPLDVLALEAEGRGIAVGGKKSYGLIGRFRWNSDGSIYATGGYHYSKCEINRDGITVDAAVNGPFIEAGLSF